MVAREHQSSGDLSTKITMIVFWGLVIVGLGFTGLLLSNIEEETLTKREAFTDSLAYQLVSRYQGSQIDPSQINKELVGILNPHSDVGVEIFEDGVSISYMNKLQGTEQTEFLSRVIDIGNSESRQYELHVLFPTLETSIQKERTNLLLLLGSLLLVFGILLRLVLERLIKAPIDRMVDVAVSISSGNTKIEFDEDRDDELGYLAQFTNKAIKTMHVQEQRAWRAKALAEVTLASISDAVITTDNNGNVEFMNEQAEHITGKKLDSCRGTSLALVTPLKREDDHTLLASPVLRCLEGNITIDIKDDCLLISHGNEEIPVSCSVSPIQDHDGDVLGSVMVLRDVSETRALHKELSYQASHDHLTGLFNRREFESEIQRLLTLAKRDGHKHAICYFDLDQFKVVNDTCGHTAGDMLLRNLVEHLKGGLRKTDLMARLGGDEFALLLPHCQMDAAVKVAHNLLTHINEFHFVWQENSFHVGASIGIAPLTEFTKNYEEAMSHADMACYAAKDLGRNRVHVYEDDDQQLKRRREEMSMISVVRDALATDRFVLYVQSIIPTGDHSDRSHFEILLRLHTEDGTLIPPGSFLPAAERYNLMPSIDRWVIEHSLKLLRDCDENICFSINISGQSINESNFLDFILQEIEINEVAPKRICFEITESEAVNNLEHARDFIKALKKQECKFALDDFGTGVSSFEYLKTLPVNYLKIDGSFVQNIDTNKVDYAMVRAIHEVAVVMDMVTIAEYVDNKKSYEMLKEIGVDYAQGFWIDKPKPASDALLTEDRKPTLSESN